MKLNQLFLLILLIICSGNFLMGQTHMGDVLLTTQTEVNNFGQNNYLVIDGTLRITGNSSSDPIISLTPLNSIKEVVETLWLFEMRLENLNGLSIEKVKHVSLDANRQLVDISALNSITSKISINADANHKLENFLFEGVDTLISFRVANSLSPKSNGLNNVVHIDENISFIQAWGNEEIDMFHSLETMGGGIRISYCSELNRVTGFQNLRKLSYISGMSNGSTIEYYSFNNLDSVGELNFIGEDISSFKFLSSLDTVGNIHIKWCDKLTNLDGLENIMQVTGCSGTSCSDIQIIENDFLGDCCAIKHLIDGDSSNGEANTVNIQDNACACVDEMTIQNTVNCTYGNALVDLYVSTNDFPSSLSWTNKAGWEGINTTCDQDPCDGIDPSWYGVTCAGTVVTGIDLSANNLNGKLLPSIGELTTLTSLNLEDNDIGEYIPPEIGDLTNLEFLSLGDNEFTGDIPTTIENLTELEELYLHSNQLEGLIPAQLDNLSNLNTLSLADNLLSGTIPNSIGNLANLGFLFLHQNELVGTIPTQFNGLSNLIQILLYDNQLVGSIPNFSTLSSLTVMDFHNNNLTGPVPANLPASVSVLRLHENKLTSSIPSTIGTLSNLTSINLSNNNLSGCYPTSLKNLCPLTNLLNPTLYFDNNPLLPAAGDFTQSCPAPSSGYFFGECGSAWDCNGTYITINDNPLPNGILKMEEYIQSAGVVDAPNMSVTFQARDSIVLLPTFEVKPNMMFEVVLDDCSN